MNGFPHYLWGKHFREGAVGMTKILLEAQNTQGGLPPVAQSMLLIAGMFVLIYLIAVLAPKISNLLVKIFPALAKVNEPKPLEPPKYKKSRWETEGLPQQEKSEDAPEASSGEWNTNEEEQSK